MTAVAVNVGEAVLSELEAGLAEDAFVRTFTPERSYADWSLELTDDDLHVDVVSLTPTATELEDRGRLVYTVPVDIGVRKRFTASEQESDSGRLAVFEIDGLVELVEQLHERFTGERMDDFDAAVWRETRIIANPSREMLMQHRQFVGIVRLTFEAEKAL